MINDPDDDGWGLLVPFVATQSSGGSFEDEAFTAGFSTGLLWMQLGIAKCTGLLPFMFTIQRDLLKQADLIAMHYDVTMTEESMSGCDEATINEDEATINEWAIVMFGWPEGESNEQERS